MFRLGLGSPTVLPIGDDSGDRFSHKGHLAEEEEEEIEEGEVC